MDKLIRLTKWQSMFASYPKFKTLKLDGLNLVAFPLKLIVP